MALEIINKEENDVVIIDLIGNLDTNTSPEAEKNINSYLEAGKKKLIINLEKTRYVSSAGLRVFLATAKKLTATGGVVKLCSANKVVQEILDISGFSTFIDVKKTQDEALLNI